MNCLIGDKNAQIKKKKYIYIYRERERETKRWGGFKK